MATAKTGKRVTVRSAEELGRVLGLSVADTAEMEFRSDLTVSLVKIIEAGSLTHAETASFAGLTDLASELSAATPAPRPRSATRSCGPAIRHRLFSPS